MQTSTKSSSVQRARPSCTECSRRKQKCDREWPCNHCRSRRVLHLCRYDLGKTAYLAPTERHETEVRPPKRRVSGDGQIEHLPAEEALPIDDEAHDGVLDSWGYMRGSAHFNLESLSDKRYESLDAQKATHNNALSAALQALSPRYLTDMLLQAFMQNDDYIVSLLYIPSLVEEYSAWWESRLQGQQPLLTFTCLLLRVCATATQTASDALQQKLKYELGFQTAHDLSQNYRKLAEDLSSKIRPGQGDLHSVVGNILSAFWAKGEGQIVDSWHAISVGVREAQELGMHRIENEPGTDALEAEMRTRIWCFLSLWDWQMAEWLDRPMLVNIHDNPFRAPNLALDADEDGRPSQFEAMFWQYKLTHMLSSRHGRLGGCFTDEEVWSIMETVDLWTAEVPRALSATDTDTSFDQKEPRLPAQRAQMDCFAKMVGLIPLKRYLTVPPSDDAALSSPLRAFTVRSCIKCLESCKVFFDVLFPIRKRFHFLMFCIFDTATVLCSAVLHDVHYTLPHRADLLEAVSKALNMLHQLAPLTKVAANSVALLSSLVAKLPLSTQERELVSNRQSGAIKRSKVATPESTAALSKRSYSTATSEDGSLVTRESSTVNDTSQTSSTTYFDSDADWQNMAELPPLQFDDFGSVDLGGIGEIWDWEALNWDLANSNVLTDPNILENVAPA